MKSRFLDRLSAGRLFFDGSTGTMLQAQGLRPGELTEMWNLTRPEAIVALHASYLAAGSDIVTTNTFGANRLKFDGREGRPALAAVVEAAVRNAKAAVAACGREAFVALDIGPTGKMLAPLGDLPFEEAVDIFGEVVEIGARCGADLVLVETMNDAYETKAAVLAAKERCDLPVVASNTYDEGAKLMGGTPPEAMVALLEGLRVDALGVNCGVGPDKMRAVAERLLAAASVPVMVSPNAGLPTLRDGRTVFETGPEAFAGEMEKIAAMGASIMGGCCGTRPEHIGAMVARVGAAGWRRPGRKGRTVVSSWARAVDLGGRPVLVGERINPTGKKAFKAALREGDLGYALREGVAQKEAGADILDVNVGLPEIDERAMLVRTVGELQAVVELPLEVDTSDPAAMAAALRMYNGKALVNSVNGKAESMAAILPLVAKYGGVVVALTLDEAGIPPDAAGRVAIAERIIAEAAKYGIGPEDVVVDPLAMAESADPAAAETTLECIRRLHAKGIRTSLGVSNVSFGLPLRPLVNAAFFTLAMGAGLDAAIMNPHSREMMDAYHAFCALARQDEHCARYIAYAASRPATADAAPGAPAQGAASASPAPSADAAASSPADALRQAIVRGLKSAAAQAATAVLEGGMAALDVVNRCVIPALDEVGRAFEAKTAFLPQLLMSAEAAQEAFGIVKAKLAEGGAAARPKKFPVVLATVKGDIHDIGKNIVRTLLENYDYEVIDLGRDVPPEAVLEAAQKAKAPLVGLSALMTTTVPAMEATVKLLHEKLPACKVVVGGAVLTQEYADRMGADHYAKDAMESVRYAESLRPAD